MGAASRGLGQGYRDESRGAASYTAVESQRIGLRLTARTITACEGRKGEEDPAVWERRFYFCDFWMSDHGAGMILVKREPPVRAARDPGSQLSQGME